ncbi:hypothetical protein CE91St41_36010 [Oscillospiraceae bacterium]|nr:hypothetical protein CE91St40_35990 [Oscillospiraceae bacterium]BDF76712.1 hypothetical protein CE91St41_36010 [Oscillospiraceae bacterium]
MKDNAIESKSKAFAIRIVRLYQFLSAEQQEYVLSKQILRSGTSIGANIREGIQGFSKNDFIFKMSTALKECSETLYWLELLHETGYLSTSQFSSIQCDAEELLKLLTAIVKSARREHAT